jgi:capsular polysaccharide biosynthesis protein
MNVLKNKMLKIRKRVSTLKNAVVFPAADFSYTEKITEIAGIETWSKNLPGYGRYFNGKHLASQKGRKLYQEKHPTRYINGRYLYIGIMHEHFGHFLCESVSMMWAAKFFETKVDGFIIIPCVDKARKCDFDKNFFTSICKIFKVNTKKLIFLNELSEVEHLIIPEIGHPPGEKPKKWYLEDLRERIYKLNLVKSNNPKKIFVRRGDAYFSKTIGINYFSKLLESNGFYILFPEKFNIFTQLSYIVSAEIIIWEEGSACHLCDLLPLLKKKESLIVKRRSYSSTADNAVVSKFNNFKIYNNVEMINLKTTKNHNDEISKFKAPDEFFMQLENYGYVKKNKFEFYNFRLSELADLLNLYKKYIIIDIKYFFVTHLKPYVSKEIWTFLKKSFSH